MELDDSFLERLQALTAQLSPAGRREFRAWLISNYDVHGDVVRFSAAHQAARMGGFERSARRDPATEP